MGYQARIFHQNRIGGQGRVDAGVAFSRSVLALTPVCIGSILALRRREQKQQFQFL